MFFLKLQALLYIASCVNRNMFKCSNEECVDPASICDGFADCSDKSDETQNLCAPLFKTYGNNLISFKALIKYI